MENLKIWFIEVAVKKMLPSLLKTGVMMLVAYMTAHKGLLSSWGIDYDPTDDTINISLKTASAAALIFAPGIVTMLLTAGQHHAVAAVEGKPQSGDMRKEAPAPYFNGSRKDDPQGA